MVVFSLFFGILAKMPSGGLPYPIFYFSALLPWMYFAGALQNATNSRGRESARHHQSVFSAAGAAPFGGGAGAARLCDGLLAVFLP